MAKDKIDRQIEKRAQELAAQGMTPARARYEAMEEAINESERRWAESATKR